MITESWAQIIDRMVIEQLKAFMHTDDGKSEQCRQQARQLGIAADEYLYECSTGKRIPYVNHSARFHDHKSHDGDESISMPQTISDAIVALSEQHYKYWQLQSRIQRIKMLLDGEGIKPNVDDNLNDQFVSLQREADMCNQNRSDIRDQLDKLLVHLFMNNSCQD